MGEERREGIDKRRKDRRKRERKEGRDMKEDIERRNQRKERRKMGTKKDKTKEIKGI